MKRIIIITVSLIALVGLFFAGKAIREEHYPINVKPSPEWEPYINSLDMQREAFFVEATDGTMLEAELFIPTAGSESKGAVVFSPGSGDSLYQNYSPGLIESYIFEIFLPRDMAVLLINKRGMGQSEGNWTKSSMQGRADDLYSAIESIKEHPVIDAENIGVIGHSQGGWVVQLVAAQHEDVAFFISLVGPTTTVLRNSGG